MRGTPGTIAVVAIAVAARAAAADTTISCKVSGMLAGSTDYKTVVEGSLTVDATTLVATPKNDQGACTPVSKSSAVFGAKKGTRLQITAHKCGSDDVYVTFRVVVKGLPVLGYMSTTDALARVQWNEDEPAADHPADPPLVLPEGKFRFLYADCARK